MRVHILLSAIGDYMPKYLQSGEKPHQALAQEIKAKALEVWKNRQPDENTVRFLQKMPAQHGSHFRFLTVRQKDEKTLLVSSGRSQ